MVANTLFCKSTVFSKTRMIHEIGFHAIIPPAGRVLPLTSPPEGALSSPTMDSARSWHLLYSVDFSEASPRWCRVNIVGR